MNTTIEALCVYFKKELIKLETNYHWSVPKIGGFNPSGKSNYEQNVQLKHHFHKRWSQATSMEDKLLIAKDVIAKWGGVRNNKDSTLEKYIARIDRMADTDGQLEMPLQGVASYSKLYSIVDMKRFAIYDARVAACLNAVQYNYSVGKGTAFNYVPGRNNIVGHAGKKIGFVHQTDFQKKKLLTMGWESVSGKDTYNRYLDTLHSCLKEIDQPANKTSYHLHDLEMVLFANAETECSKAMSMSSNLTNRAA